MLQHQPDEPVKAFNGGKLGILWPKFERRYLVIAYRYLEQKPLTAEERQSLDDAAGPHITPPGTPYDPDPPVTAWLKARSHVLGLQEVQKIDIQRYRRNGFAQYPNCGDDAFTNAASTATSRSQTFGIASRTDARVGCGTGRGLPELRQRCGPSVLRPGPEAAARTLHLPPPATLNNALLKLDRQYQVAAANFYGGDFDTAASDFEQIAREPGLSVAQAGAVPGGAMLYPQGDGRSEGREPFLPEPMRAARNVCRRSWPTSRWPACIRRRSVCSTTWKRGCIPSSGCTRLLRSWRPGQEHSLSASCLITPFCSITAPRAAGAER